LPEDAKVVRTFASDPVPAEPDALLVLGGGMSAWHPLPHLRDELRLIQRCLEAEKPVLGICLGSQLLASALGAEVGRAPRKEIGFYRVTCDPTVFGTDSFVAFHWHSDAFTLPPGAQGLASSTLTPLQAFRYGPRALGVQFHLEIDDEVLGAMIESGGPELAEAGVDPEALRAQARREVPRLRGVASKVFAEWLNA
jgi:GMP synthase (glutamine-hydrolysing)